MKKLISLLFAFGLAGSAFAQQGQLNPFNGSQQLYVDVNFHSVPYFLSFPNNGVTTIVFDPSTSATDQANAFRHAQKAWAAAATNSETIAGPVVLPNVVNLNINVQETRVAVPFSVTASTTLTTIPFNYPVVVQTNGHYRFVAKLFLNTGGGGSKVDIGGTCNTSNFVAHITGFGTSTTILYASNVTSFLSGPGGSSTAGAYVDIAGEMDVTNGGTFVLQFAQNGSNATASTVLAGSTFTVIQIP